MPDPIVTPSVQSPAPSGGQTDAGSPDNDPRAVLAAMVEQRESPAARANENSPTPSAQDDPANPPPPAEGDAAGQTDLPPEESPPAEGQPEAEGESENVLSQPENAELVQALTGLSPAEREHALALVKNLEPGEIPRFSKVIAERTELRRTVEEQAREIEELKTAPPETAVAPGQVPPSVAKLKTLQEVQARQAKAETSSEYLQDFLDANPGSPDTVYDLQTEQAVSVEPDGKRFLTRRELIAEKARWRTELKALPKKAQEIVDLVQFQKVQQTREAAALAAYPWLKDADHPVTKRIAETLETVPALKRTDAPKYWAAVYLKGLDAMNAELAARKAKGNGHAANGAGGAAGGTRPVGKVPARNPHAGGGTGVPARSAEAVDVKSALDRIGKEHSLAAGAALLEATGR